MAFQIVKQAYAVCNPGAGSLDLGECFSLGIGSNETVRNVYDKPAVLVSVISNAVIVIGGLVFFITLIYAGIQFIRSGTKGKEDAKKIMEVALIGMITMFIAYWIVQIFGIVFGLGPNFI